MVMELVEEARIPHDGIITGYDGNIVMVSRLPRESEGTRPRQILCDDAFGDEDDITGLTAMASRFIQQARHLILREEVLHENGWTTESAPPWSFHVHPLSVAFMRHFGRDEMDLVRLRHDMRDSSGWMSRAQLLDDSTDVAARCDGARASMRWNTDRDLTYTDMGTNPVIRLPESLPQTVLHAMPGKKIGALLDGPEFAHLDVVITEVIQTADGRQFVGLEDVRVPAAPAPSAVDATWLIPCRGHD